MHLIHYSRSLCLYGPTHHLETLGVFFLILTLFLSSHSFADNHDAEQNIIERAKEINQQVKEKQAFCKCQLKNTSSIQTLHYGMSWVGNQQNSNWINLFIYKNSLKIKMKESI